MGKESGDYNDTLLLLPYAFENENLLPKFKSRDPTRVHAPS